MRNTWVFFGGCAGEARFPVLVANLIGVVSGAREAVLRAGGLRGEEFDAAIARVREWGKRDEVAAWFSMCWAEGSRPR